MNTGTTSTTTTPSGNPFAGSENIESLEGRYSLVGRLVLFVVDWETGEKSIVVTDEQLVLNFTDDPNAEFLESITFNGKKYLLDGGQADLPNGEVLRVSNAGYQT